MLKNQLPKFSEMITALAELYEKPMSNLLIDLYWATLKDYPLEKIEDAVVNIIRTHKYASMPKPADFIEFICPQGDADSKAELALEEFFERLRESGYHSFTWRDPVLAMTIQHYGGWRSIIDTYPRHDDKEAKFWLMDFKRTYKAFIKNPRNIDLKFIGSIKAENKAKGYVTNETGNPVLIDYIWKDKNEVEHRDRIPLLANSPEAQKYIEAKEQKLLAETT